MITTNETELRKCNLCGGEWPLSEYHKDRTLRGGHRYTCKRCAKEATRRSYHSKNADTNGLYGVFASMKKRCYNRNHISYSRYGGRGITICDGWLQAPESFFSWALANGYRRGLQIDRIDNDRGYAPENCRFASPSTNIRNRSCTKLTADDVLQIRRLLASGFPQRTIARIFGTHCSTICNINRGTVWRDAP